MNCPDCQRQQVVRNGKTSRQDGSVVQKYLSTGCGFSKSETEILNNRFNGAFNEAKDLF